MHAPIYAEQYAGNVSEGTSTPQLIFDETRTLWLVKSVASLQANVSGQKTLFNDYVATRIAEELGLPVSDVASMFIDNEFLEVYPELKTSQRGSFSKGFHLAIRHLKGFSLTTLFNALKSKPDLLKSRIENGAASNGIMVFDTWTYNHDRAFHLAPLLKGENYGNIYLHQQPNKKYKLVMIDHGLSFGGDWKTSPKEVQDSSGYAWHNSIIGDMTFYFDNDWIDQNICEKWCDYMAGVSYATIIKIMQEVPSGWCPLITQEDKEALAVHLTKRGANIKTWVQIQLGKIFSEVSGRF